jgi:hypothetical protein
MSFLNFFLDLFLVSSIEWRRSAEDDKGDYSNGPDVTLFVVFFIQDLRSDVVWLGELIK